jgi:hypothetical protein
VGEREDGLQETVNKTYNLAWVFCVSLLVEAKEVAEDMTDMNARLHQKGVTRGCLRQ